MNNLEDAKVSVSSEKLCLFPPKNSGFGRKVAYCGKTKEMKLSSSYWFLFLSFHLFPWHDVEGDDQRRVSRLCHSEDRSWQTRHRLGKASDEAEIHARWQDSRRLWQNVTDNQEAWAPASMDNKQFPSWVHAHRFEYFWSSASFFFFYT